MAVALRVAKAGYYGGDPGAVMAARVDHVMSVLDYEKFQIDYERAYRELNK